MRKICWLMVMCILCSGCKTLDSFLRKEESLPVIKASQQQPETETVWVNAKTKKVWINPLVDEEGNMVEGHYKYIVLEKGHWALQETAPESLAIKETIKDDKDKR